MRFFTGGLRYDHVKFEIEDKFLANGDQSETLKFNELNYSIGASYELLLHLIFMQIVQQLLKLQLLLNF